MKRFTFTAFYMIDRAQSAVKSKLIIRARKLDGFWIAFYREYHQNKVSDIFNTSNN